MALIDPAPSVTAPNPEPAPEPAPPGLGRRFLTVWTGQTISTIGSAVSGVGIAVYVFVTTGSLAWLGLLTAVETLPVLLTGPFLRLTDRYDRRTVMIRADIAAAIGPAIALAIALFGELQPWHLAVAGFAGGLGTSFQVPAYQAALPHLVDGDAIERANGLVQLGPAAALVLGPAIATPIVAWWGIEAILVVDLSTFLIGAAVTGFTKFSAIGTQEAGDDGSNRAAFTWLKGPGRPLLVLLAVMACVNLVLAFFSLALFALAVDLGGAARAGLAPAVGGIAMIAAGIAMAKRGLPDRRTGALAFAIVMMAAGAMIAAIRPSFWLLLVGAAVALASVPIGSASVATMFHEHVPDSMHGRVFGLRGVLGQVLYPLGSVTAGLVGARLAAPAMSEGGALSSSIGRIIGVGPERGPAVMLIAVAVALMLLMIPLTRNRDVRSLDRARADQPEPVTTPNLGV
jgi:DHA3 family macrolide efflux protein-like MFS transporter